MKFNASAMSGAQPGRLLLTLPTAAVLCIAALLNACATLSPESQSALARARTEVQALEADPMATQAAG